MSTTLRKGLATINLQRSQFVPSVEVEFSNGVYFNLPKKIGVQNCQNILGSETGIASQMSTGRICLHMPCIYLIQMIFESSSESRTKCMIWLSHISQSASDWPIFSQLHVHSLFKSENHLQKTIWICIFMDLPKVVNAPYHALQHAAKGQTWYNYRLDDNPSEKIPRKLIYTP